MNHPYVISMVYTHKKLSIFGDGGSALPSGLPRQGGGWPCHRYRRRIVWAHSFRRTAVASDMSRARESSGKTKETSLKQRNHGDVVPSPAKCESASHLNQQGGGVPKKNGWNLLCDGRRSDDHRTGWSERETSLRRNGKEKGPLSSTNKWEKAIYDMIPSGNLT